MTRIQIDGSRWCAYFFVRNLVGHVLDEMRFSAVGAGASLGRCESGRTNIISTVHIV